jgi:hypothetical protein
MPLGMCLGCNQSKREARLPGGGFASVVEYGTESFLDQHAQRYLECAGPDCALRRAETPFLTEDHRSTPAVRPRGAGSAGECPWRARTLDASKAQVASKKAKRGPQVAQEPSDDEDPAEDVPRGELAQEAARVLMKIPHAARMARFDLLRAVGGLACFLTKWTMERDARLCRLAGYFQTTKHFKMRGRVGDEPRDLGLHFFADADFAGCGSTAKSTTGVRLAARGASSSFPIVGHSKKQSCISHSTLEAELIAASFALRGCGIPALVLWPKLVPEIRQVVFHEDNQAMIAVVRSGRSPTKRHTGRTRGIAVSSLRERFQQVDFP